MLFVGMARLLVTTARGGLRSREARARKRSLTLAPYRGTVARIEDYGLIGDTQTAALVGRDASIDWLCLPRFDSAACFAALLGGADNGRWQIAPADGWRSVERRYRPGTLVLETEFRTASGRVRVVDCMPNRLDDPDVVRLVQGVSGHVHMHMELTVRFDYGRVIPWVRQLDGRLQLIAGPDALYLTSSGAHPHGKGLTTIADFTVADGQQAAFSLRWHPSHLPPPPAIDPVWAITTTEHWWQEWTGRCTYTGGWHDAVTRSLVTLKALTYGPTGGIVAAPTTSLPEDPGGSRNWDYRYCWLRDATFALYALHIGGYTGEANAWRDWLLRAAAGHPAQVQILYGAAGEQRLTEVELPWLAGYEGASPVRVGNAAYDQFQLDVYGEVMDALHLARRAGMAADASTWDLQRALVAFVEDHWSEKDNGIWEVRGPQRHFTHSKVMAWVAIDRAVKSVERYGTDGPIDTWRALRARIHDEVCREGFDGDRNTFTQYYGSHNLDASLLMIPLVGFLPPTDARVRGTVEAIERELCTDGFVRRYDTDETADGVHGAEGAFLPCNFWLVDNLALLGRASDARERFEALLDLRNDLGLLPEEYDPVSRRFLGNFPQALTHVGLVNSAMNLSSGHGPAEDRRAG
jgi:GH15 family glucan-1,4-alpha-glucosidase